MFQTTNQLYTCTHVTFTYSNTIHYTTINQGQDRLVLMLWEVCSAGKAAWQQALAATIWLSNIAMENPTMNRGFNGKIIYKWRF